MEVELRHDVQGREDFRFAILDFRLEGGFGIYELRFTIYDLKE